MANRILTADIIAAEAVMNLENSLVMSNLVFRGYEEDFDKRINGYTPGETVSIRRPADFTVRTGRTATIQDVVEGKFTLTVGTLKGVDFQLTSQELTMNVEDLSERKIKPAMIQLANDIDASLFALYKDVWNWVGVPGQVINSFADFALAPERLDNGAVPQDTRYGVLSPSDYWAQAGSQSALYMQDVARDAYRRGKVGAIGDIETYKAQNVQVHSRGTVTQATPIVVGSQSTTYDSTKDTGKMDLGTRGWLQTGTIKQGDVFTIDGVYAVNPVSKATQAYLQQFVVRTDLTTTAITQTNTLSISPPIITTGAFQTVSAAPANSATITVMGSASTNYPQNLVFHKNAFALCIVPLVRPPGAVDVGRKERKGVSARVIPYYTGSNDTSAWRIDVLYGLCTIDARLATRLSGT